MWHRPSCNRQRPVIGVDLPVNRGYDQPAATVHPEGQLRFYFIQTSPLRHSIPRETKGQIHDDGDNGKDKTRQ